MSTSTSIPGPTTKTEERPRRAEGEERRAAPTSDSGKRRDSERPREERKGDKPKEERRDGRGAERRSPDERGGQTRDRERSGKVSEAPVPQKKDDHLNELRAALAKIAESEKQAPPVEVVNSAEQKSEGWVPEETIRVPQDTIPSTPVLAETSHAPQNIREYSEQRRESVPVSEPTPERPSIPEPPPQGEKLVHTATKEKVTPHELERMMRVTTSDKPPY